MKLLVVVFLISMIGINSVLACHCHCSCRDPDPDIEDLIVPAKKDDMKGFQELVKSFLKVVTKGLRKYNIQSLDPLEFPILKVDLQNGLRFHFTDLVVRNLSNVDIYNSILDTKANTTEIELKLNLNMTATVAIQLNDDEIELAVGNIQLYLKTNELPCTTKYGFTATPDKNGVTYFTVLQEKTKCNIINNADLTFSPSLYEVIQQDEDIHRCHVPFNPEDQTWKNQLTVNIVKVVVARMIDNFRIACRLMPAHKYVTDIDS